MGVITWSSNHYLAAGRKMVPRRGCWHYFFVNSPTDLRGRPPVSIVTLEGKSPFSLPLSCNQTKSLFLPPSLGPSRRPRRLNQNRIVKVIDRLETRSLLYNTNLLK